MVILILGNGLSRLAFDQKIREYKGEIWGCNRVFIDYGDKINALHGHADVMEEAEVWRVTHGQAFKIFNKGEEITCPEIYRKDTGSTLVAEALTRGHDVICAGFDLGGADCYSPNHEKKNKSTWVMRWRLIFSEFDSARVTFWGHDHKEFILSNRPANEYSRKYTRGEAHIPGVAQSKTDYSRLWENVPRVYLRNMGQREWRFIETPETLKQGGKIKIPECVAKKYVDLYKKEFAIEPIVDMLA